MRVALLTTDTSHHAYYAWRLREHVELAHIFIEHKGAGAPFDTHHPFEQERDDYEREVLLADVADPLAQLAPSTAVKTMNDPDARAGLARVAPDLVLVFGTGLLGRELIDEVPAPLLNLHGGNPEEYRGLDTHLWTVYHGDFANLVTTLHLVDAELDTGAIVAQGGLEFAPGAQLHELRAVNTKLCVDLSVAAASSYERLSRLPARRQLRRGRYYSWMPAVLKQRCVDRFERWTTPG